MTTVERRKLGLTHYDNKTAGGYTLFAPQTGGGRIPLIDDGGEVVHTNGICLLDQGVMQYC